MKHQALFSLKDKSNKVKVSSAAFLFGALRVKNRLICSTFILMSNIIIPKYHVLT